MEIHLKIIGVLLIALAGLHIYFPKYFQWKEDLKSLSLINRQMMKGHTFFIALIVFLIGLLSLIASSDLVQTNLGKTVSIGLGLFWFMRLYFQLFVYSPKLWKGKRFETIVHICFLLLWIYLSSVYLLIGFQY